jgi:hypothetical protein
MESLRIDIVNPKARAILRDLAALNLIRIKKDKSKSEFPELLARLKKHSGDTPSLEEITEEVEAVREARQL